MTSILAQNKRTLSNPQTIGEVLMKELLINNEKINRALKKYPHMQEASFNQGSRGQSICWSEVDTYHQQDGGLFASRIRTINKTEACLQAKCMQCHSEVLHVAEKRHPVSCMAKTVE